MQSALKKYDVVKSSFNLSSLLKVHGRLSPRDGSLDSSAADMRNISDKSLLYIDRPRIILQGSWSWNNPGSDDFAVESSSSLLEISVYLRLHGYSMPCSYTVS